MQMKFKLPLLLAVLSLAAVLCSGCCVSHEYSPATCTEPETCLKCGKSRGKPLGHSSVTVEGFEAACTEPGLSDGAVCEVCGAVLAEQKEIPAKGHTGEVDPAVWATPEQPGLTEGEHCAVCGKVLKVQKTVELTEDDAVYYDAAQLFFGEKDYKTAFYNLYQERYHEDPRVMYILGECYYYPLGTLKNNYLAYHSFLSSAENGYALSWLYLGLCYRYGVGMHVNEAESQACFDKFYSMAEEQYEKSIFLYEKRDIAAHMGKAIQHGWGRESNYEEMALWFGKASELGDPYADLVLGSLHLYGYGVAQDKEKSREYITRAAENGEPGAMLCLYAFYTEGIGCEPDKDMASRWKANGLKAGLDGNLYSARRPYVIKYTPSGAVYTPFIEE